MAIFSDELQNLFTEFEGMKAALHEARVKLEVQTKELMVKNKDLEDAKRATLNLLEDLETEKANVEKKVEERTLELAEEKTKLAHIANYMEMGALLVDHEGGIIFSNKKIRETLGLGDVAGDTEVLEKFFEKFAKYDIKRYFTACVSGNPNDLHEAETGGRIYEILFRCLSELKDGKPWHFGHLFWVRDITDVKMLERSREEFFAIASHEMRTPLTAIRGNMSLIKDFFGAKLKNPEVKEMIDDSYHASVRLIGIVNDFLDASRLEQGKISLKKENVDLAALAAQVVRELGALAGSKKLGLKFKTENAVPLPPVSADQDRAKQVIYNLISNALNYTQKGGVGIEMAQKDNFIKVSVSDTGKGISLQNQNLLFRKFQQAGETILARDITKSTGLGLYISKLLVEAMGGKIWLEHSEPDKGSVFAFTLPIVA